jgi:hypothetical protein
VAQKRSVLIFGGSKKIIDDAKRGEKIEKVEKVEKKPKPKFSLILAAT